MERGAAASEVQHKKQPEDGKETGGGEVCVACRGSQDIGSRDAAAGHKRLSKVRIIIAHHIVL